MIGGGGERLWARKVYAVRSVKWDARREVGK